MGLHAGIEGSACDLPKAQAAHVEQPLIIIGSEGALRQPAVGVERKRRDAYPQSHRQRAAGGMVNGGCDPGGEHLSHRAIRWPVS